MVSARLDGLVTGWVRRTYLEGIEGFWADEVLREFVYLEERGFALEEILFHQNGNGMTYRGDELVVILDYEPEYEPPNIGAWIGRPGREEDGIIPIDRLILAGDPLAQLPPRPPMDRDAVRANVGFWADGLRRLMDRPGGLAG
jgi:hypothetical protein